jgi:hypothetical protein
MTLVCFIYAYLLEFFVNSLFSFVSIVGNSMIVIKQRLKINIKFEDCILSCVVFILKSLQTWFNLEIKRFRRMYSYFLKFKIPVGEYLLPMIHHISHC